jgi:hypothetical protein
MSPEQATQPVLRLGAIVTSADKCSRSRRPCRLRTGHQKRTRLLRRGRQYKRASTEKSHLSLPISGRKAIATLSGITFQIPSKSSVYAFQNCHGFGRIGVEQAPAGFLEKQNSRASIQSPAGQSWSIPPRTVGQIIVAKQLCRDRHRFRQTDLGAPVQAGL